jgi:hypothetical protein
MDLGLFWFGGELERRRGFSIDIKELKIEYQIDGQIAPRVRLRPALWVSTGATRHARPTTG